MTILLITGMTCHNCVKHVTQALQAIPGVIHVQVDLASGRAEVKGAIDADALLAAISEEGYDAKLQG